MKSVYKISALFLLIGGLSSCLKRDSTFDASDSPSVVAFENTGDPAFDTFPYFSSDVGKVDLGDSGTFNINLVYSGAVNAPSDVTVTLAIDEAALTAYNNAEGTDYTLPPAEVLSIPQTVVIKKGTHELQVKATVIRTSAYDFDADYAVPLKIAATTSGYISSNFGEAIYGFSLRNKYDGSYNVTGTFKDLTLTGATAQYPRTVFLVTAGASSVAYYDSANARYGYPFYSGGNTYYGNFDAVFNFDTDGNVTSVTNYYGQGTANSSNRSAELDPGGVNKITFDAEGKPATLQVSYIMVQAGVERTFITENFTYQGSR